MTTSTTLTFLATFATDPAQRSAVAAQCDAYARHVRTEEPDTLALTLALNDAGDELHVLQTTTSPEAFDTHMRGAQQLIGEALDRVTVKHAVVYGHPGPVLAGALEANRAGGAAVTVVGTQLADFHRNVAA